MSRQSKLPLTETHPKSLITQSKTQTVNSLSTTKTKSKKSSRQFLSKPAIIALILLILASAAGVAFSIITSIVLHLHTEGDIPSRIIVFVASVLSIVEGILYVFVFFRRKHTVTTKKSKSTSIRASVLILSRLILVAWIASSVLTGLLIAQLAGNGVLAFSLSAPLVDQAIYLDLIISSVALVSSGVLSYYSERSCSPFKGALSTQRSVIDVRDADVESLESIDIRDTIFDGDLITNTMGAASDMRGQISTSKIIAMSEDDLSAEPRQKKLLFSYKSTTQLVDENQTPQDSRRESTGVTNSAKKLGAKNIKRKPVPSIGQQEAFSIIPEMPVASTFFLSPSIDDSDDHITRMVPYSPTVNRPVSLVPPIPVVPFISSTKNHLGQTTKVDSIKRKPVGAPTPNVVPMRRNPVEILYSSTPLLPTIVEPSIETAPTIHASVSDSIQPLSAKRSSKQIRTVSMVSLTSTYSIPSPILPHQSLADMIVSSLRRDSVASYPTPPPPTSTVTYSKPKLFDQPIVRRSFIATSGGFGLPAGMSTGSNAGNSRRPSAVSIMETIYSPAEEEKLEARPDMEYGDDADLIAIMKEEATAAAIFANAGRHSAGFSPALTSKDTTSSHPVSATFSALIMPTTTRRVRKEFAKSAKSPKSPARSRRSPTRVGHNFSRPMRATSRLSPSSPTPLNFGKMSHAKKTPRSSATLSPRSRVRRQLLQMLPIQYQPKPTAISTELQARASLSGRRHRKSLSIFLDYDSKQGYSSDSGPESGTSWHASSRISQPPNRLHRRGRRSLPLATKAWSAHRRHRSRRIAGLQSSTMQTMSHKHHSRKINDYKPSHLSLYTPPNRPISPMTLLMKRSLRYTDKT